MIDFKRISIDYPLFILDFNLAGQRMVEMDIRKMKLIKVNNDIVWNIYSQDLTEKKKPNKKFPIFRKEY